MMRGQLTVFLAMILTTILSLATTLIAGARYSAMRVEIATVHETAGYSVLSQYHRLLFERYGLLFFFTGDLADKNKELMNRNFKRDQIGKILSVRDMLALTVEENQIEGISLATDGNGQVLRRQCVICMEEQYGISYLKQLGDRLAKIEGLGVLEEEPTYHICEEVWSKEGLKTETDALLSQTVIPKSFHYIEQEALRFMIGGKDYSNKELNKSEAVTGRALIQGRGLSEKLQFRDDSWAKLLFVEYILKHTGDYTDPCIDGCLEYQIEYILSGEETDGSNLWNTASRLLEVRTCANVLGILANESRCGFVGELSKTLAAAIGNPELEVLISAALILIWGEVEGIYDVRKLLQGQGVNLIKADEEWLIDISTIANIATLSNAENSEGKGNKLLVEEEKLDGEKEQCVDREEMKYKDYLRLLLWVQDKEILTLRLMDIIEADIRAVSGQKSFCLDYYADYFWVKTKVKSAYGEEFEIAREYGY